MTQECPRRSKVGPTMVLNEHVLGYDLNLSWINVNSFASAIDLLTLPIILNEKNLTKGYWALAVISIFWGSTWFVSKLTVAHIPPLQMTGIRQTAAGLLLIIFFSLKGIKIPSLRMLGFHLLCGFLLITCSNGLTTWAIKFIPSFLGALIACLMPFVMIIANSVLFKEKVKPVVYLALIIGFSGVALLLSSFSEEMKGGNFLFGILLSLISIGTWTSGTLLSTRNQLNNNPFEGIGWQMLLGGLLLLLASGIGGQHVPLAGVPTEAWIELSYLTLVGSILCFMCYLYALKTLPMSLVSIYVYINPIFAFLLGVLFLNEKVTPRILVGIVITFIGIYLVKRYSSNNK